MQTNAATINQSVDKIEKRNQTTTSERIRSYITHPGSGVLALLTVGAAVITFAVLMFLVGYILVKGIPYLTPELFSLEYTSENVSLLPSLINTFIMTALSLVIAAPIGIFAAIYLVEYAKKGNKLVQVIRITAETLSGIPSIVYGLFGMSVLCNSTSLGLIPSGRCLYTGDHGTSIDHENLRRSTESSSGFLQRSKFWTGSRKTENNLYNRITISSSWYSGRYHPCHRTYRWRDGSTDLYFRYCCTDSET